MKKYSRLLIILMFALLFFFAICYTYCLRPIVDDEFYNYGFAKSILDGRVPYVDFNMIIPPLFSYLLAFIFRITFRHLLVFHFLMAFFSAFVTYLAFRKIGFRALAIYALMLIYPYTGYNTFCLMLFFIILCLRDKFGKYEDYIDAFIISLMFLSKQTLGILMIPCFIYSRHKKKTLVIYLISFLGLFIYLFTYHSLLEFINYCFLGMFDFTSHNGKFTPLLLVEIVILLILLMKGIQKKDKLYFYVLCFQIITFPDVNYVHFIIGFIPVMYMLLCRFKNHFIGTVFFVGFSISYLFIFSFANLVQNYQFLDFYSDGHFMKGRLVYSSVSSYISRVSNYLENYPDYDVYILGNLSYLTKLNLELPINKFDIINDGNMGYHGEKVYIKEIHDNCLSKKCLFIVSEREMLGKVENQTNRSILQYIGKTYFKRYISGMFSVYDNQFS